MKRFKSLGFFIFCCFVLVATGCGLNGNSREFTLFGKGVNIAGANQPFLESIEKFDDARLVAVLDPDDKLNLGKEILKEKTLTALDLERAFYKADGYDKKGIHWNRIQERLILASQQACNFYKDYLRRIDSYESFLLGGLSRSHFITHSRGFHPCEKADKIKAFDGRRFRERGYEMTSIVLGGASAIVTGASGARILGGLSGITSGVDAEFSQAFFKDVAVHVITPGVDSRRDRKLKAIRGKQGRNINKYNVQAAIRDALDYHNQCTLNAGMEEAADSIKTVRDPGMTAARETLRKAIGLQKDIGKLETATAERAEKIKRKLEEEELLEGPNPSFELKEKIPESGIIGAKMEASVKKSVAALKKEVATLKTAKKITDGEAANVTARLNLIDTQLKKLGSVQLKAIVAAALKIADSQGILWGQKHAEFLLKKDPGKKLNLKYELKAIHDKIVKKGDELDVFLTELEKLVSAGKSIASELKEIGKRK
ncbi:MAG: hypothetical protein QF774_00320 [Nitrospinota bacterium]|nr:hypothetical protein [Nitrospinota bacterium]